ncbi:unnamed protein product, partial [Strongylus vulgaris]
MIGELKRYKFELAYSETLDFCAPGIFEILNIKNIVLLSASGAVPRMYEVAGLSDIPSFIPGFVTPFSDDMTFMERLTNFKLNIQFKHLNNKWDTRFEKLFNSKFPAFPTLQEIYFKKTALIMINVHEFAETPRPRSNMIRYIGGSALAQPKPLEKELDNLLNKRNKTVLFSMGSVARSMDMPVWMKNDIIETFDSFPEVTFIWKYEGDDIGFKSHPNIYPLKWIPQIDLLADKRLSLFVTHGGMNSLLEAMFHGKPVIVVPLFGDQQYNSKIIQKRGIGIIVEKNKLNKETLTEAIQRMLDNKKITREAAFVATMLKGRPQQYREDIAKWAKFIIEHGRMDHLILHSRNMSFIQYYCLDVLALLAT